LRSALFAVMAALLSGSCAGGAEPGPTTEHARPETKSYEMTFLRSKESDPADLVAFIERNWFAMDAKATAQGLMSSYRLMSSTGDDSPWNVVVIVGYPTRDGYDAIAPAFERIRADHVVTPVNGKTRIADIGTIVGTRRVFPNEGELPW
jgi:hypothetical protein